MKQFFFMKRRSPSRAARAPGHTIIEVLIACVLFSVLVLVCFMLMRYGAQSWRSVGTRLDAQKSIQQVKNMLRLELSRTAWSSVVIYQEPDDYRHAICFKSAMDDEHNIYLTEIDTGRARWQKYLLFYVVKPGASRVHSGISCAAETGRDDAGEKDLKCPHKWIVRKDLALDAAITASPSSLVPFLSAPESVESLRAPEDHVLAARVVAQDILGFSARKVQSASMNEVDITLKIFKTQEAASEMTIGGTNLSDSRFTVQVNAAVLPCN